MSYPPDHKARTHARIIDSAAKSFREQGVQSTGIDQLMAAAGLTRGGFYAHFESKAALFGEVLRRAFTEASENLFSRGLERQSGAQWIAAATQRYLAPKHRDTPGEGCAIPTLGAEVARAPGEVKATFGRELEALLALVMERGQVTREEATTLLSTWCGAMMLARAVEDPKQSEAILEACRARIAGEVS